MMMVKGRCLAGARPVSGARLRRLGFATICGCVSLVLACERPAEAGAEVKAEPSRTPAPVAGEAEASAQPAAQGSYREDSFDLSLEVPKELEVGKPAEATVVLQAKKPYKVNDEYPIKLTVKDSPGLGLTGTIGKDRVTLEAQRAVMKVSFTPQTAGEHSLGGRFAFSVCTDERCLIEKRDLGVRVVVR